MRVRKRVFAAVLALSLLALLVAASTVVAAEEEGKAASEEEAKAIANGWIAIAAGITMVGSAIAAGIAIASTGTAATGATAEKPEVFGRVLIFVALAEALAIYGLLIAFMLWTKIS
ncbi:MAG: hypothetical protein N2V73_04015 [Candidatus Methanospirare jalkutatii]|nr:hypothetical protein [Candidatus Methanospirare jalkutatii]